MLKSIGWKIEVRFPIAVRNFSL